MTPAYTDLKLATGALWARYGSVTFTGGRDQWRQLAQINASDTEILELFKYHTGLGGGRAGPDILHTESRPYPLRMEIFKEIGQPPYLTLIGDGVPSGPVTALRLAWGIKSNVPYQLTLFDTLA